MALEFHPFWKDPDHIAELRRLSALCLFLLKEEKKATRRPLKALHDGIAVYYPNADAETYQQVYRFINFSNTPNTPALMDALAKAVFAEFDRLAPVGIPNDKRKFPRLEEAFNPYVDLRTKFKAYQAPESSAPPERQTRILRADWKISIEQSLAAWNYLYDQSRLPNQAPDTPARYFACYRYSLALGYIAKSRITIFPPTPRDPFCRFENRFKNLEGSTRDAYGVCYRENDWIYLHGQIADTAALKILALHAEGKSGPPILRGVILSRAGKPLVSRVALQEVSEEIPDSELKEAPESTEKEFSSPEFVSTIVPNIKNYVEFLLREKIFERRREKARSVDVEIEQAEMVAEVGRLLKDRFWIKKGKSKKMPFNPAAHTHYPFNQAISIPD